MSITKKQPLFDRAEFDRLVMQHDMICHLQQRMQPSSEVDGQSPDGEDT